MVFYGPAYLIFTRMPLNCIAGCALPAGPIGNCVVLVPIVTPMDPFISENLQSIICEPRLSSTKRAVISSVLESIQE